MTNVSPEREINRKRQFDKRSRCHDPMGFVDRYKLRDADQCGYSNGALCPSRFLGLRHWFDPVTDTWNCLRVGVESKC